MRLPWVLVAVLSVLVAVLAATSTGLAVELASHHQAAVAPRPAVTVTASAKAVTRWRTRRVTRTVTRTDPAMQQCAEELMGAWETDGRYADIGKLPPSAAQGYNPVVSACEQFSAVWNTPPDQTP